MHVVYSAGFGENAHGWVDMVCRGKGTRIHAAEKILWDGRVSVQWQQNVWLNNAVMVELLHNFCSPGN